MSDDGPKPMDQQLASCSFEDRGDNWCNGDQLVQQVLKLAMPVFEPAFPGCLALLLCDNAPCLSAYSSDAPRACMMNLRPGGGQPVL